MANETLNISSMSAPEEECFVCSNGSKINHLCLNIAEFNNLAIADKEQKNEENEFIFHNQEEPMEEIEDQIVEYSLEGEEDPEEADLSIISYLEESQGYQTNLHTPPRPARPQRRSSTPDITRSRRALSFDEFIENLVDDNQEMPGLEPLNFDISMEEDSLEELMEF